LNSPEEEETGGETAEGEEESDETGALRRSSHSSLVDPIER